MFLLVNKNLRITQIAHKNLFKGQKNKTCHKKQPLECTIPQIPQVSPQIPQVYICNIMILKVKNGLKTLKQLKQLKQLQTVRRIAKNSQSASFLLIIFR